MDTDGVVFDTLDTQMKECFVSGQKTTRANQINSDDPNATQLNSDAESIEAKPPNQKEKTNCLKWRFDYPKESEMIPLSLFPPNWWDALCRNEQWAINILKDDLKF